MASAARSPKEPSQGDSVPHSSSSSVQSANSPPLSPRNRPHTNRRSAKPTPNHANTAQLPVTDEPPNLPPGDTSSQGGSRRPSPSSMRRSSLPLEGPLTYTPTTHRVSKAKKGKRVHACEFPGCNKVSGSFRPSDCRIPPSHCFFSQSNDADPRRFSPEPNIEGRWTLEMGTFTSKRVLTSFRRHELNHNPEASYACNRDGCRKAFHRLDLLQRHQERQ